MVKKKKVCVGGGKKWANRKKEAKEKMEVRKYIKEKMEKRMFPLKERKEIN